MTFIDLDRIGEMMAENLRFHQAQRDTYEATTRARLAAVKAVTGLAHYAQIADEQYAARKGGAE